MLVMPKERVDAHMYGMHLGKVIDNADPEGLGRVKVIVPGLLEPESDWCYPLGQAGAGVNRGHWAIPQLSSMVAVFLAGGDVDRPYYIAGNWTMDRATGLPNTPTDAAEAVKEDPANASEVTVIESKHFTITFDDREGKEYLHMRHKPSGDFVEIDGANRGIYLRSTTGIVLESDGLIALKGLQVQVNNRIVWPTDKPI